MKAQYIKYFITIQQTEVLRFHLFFSPHALSVYYEVAVKE